MALSRLRLMMQARVIQSEVSAGTYPETVTIDKSLTVLGPNETVNPNTGARGAEALIEYPVGLTEDKDLVDIFADDVTFSGFEVDGQNLDTATYWGEGIYSEGNNVTIKNNIVKNFLTLGIRTAAAHGGPYFTGILVENNKVTSDDSETYFYMYSGIYIQGSQGTVKGNVIDSAYRGIQIQPYTNPATVQGVVENNTITAYRSPLYFNYSEHANSDWIFRNNVVDGMSISADPVSEWDGIVVQTFYAGNVVFENNTVDIGTTNADLVYMFREIKPTGGTVDVEDTLDNNTWEKVVVIRDSLGDIKESVDGESTFYTSIQEAIDDADPGDTVEVSSGTFVEKITIDKS